jgi:hypothetical protein
MIDVRKLRVLAELERLGTVAAVAEALHLTPPAVSMQLSAFERELGISELGPVVMKGVPRPIRLWRADAT